MNTQIVMVRGQGGRFTAGAKMFKQTGLRSRNEKVHQTGR